MSKMNVSKVPSYSMTRKCYCGVVFEKYKGKKYCSDKCAKEMLQRQLKEVDRKRKQQRAEQESEVQCGACKKFFVQKHRNEKYCSDPCRAIGLMHAVQRQRERRAEAKRQRAEELGID